MESFFQMDDLVGTSISGNHHMDLICLPYARTKRILICSRGHRTNRKAKTFFGHVWKCLEEWPHLFGNIWKCLEKVFLEIFGYTNNSLYLLPRGRWPSLGDITFHATFTFLLPQISPHPKPPSPAPPPCQILQSPGRSQGNSPGTMATAEIAKIQRSSRCFSDLGLSIVMGLPPSSLDALFPGENRSWKWMTGGTSRCFSDISSHEHGSRSLSLAITGNWKTVGQTTQTSRKGFLGLSSSSWVAWAP